MKDLCPRCEKDQPVMPVHSVIIKSARTKLWYSIPVHLWLCQICGEKFEDRRYPWDELETLFALEKNDPAPSLPQPNK